MDDETANSDGAWTMQGPLSTEHITIPLEPSGLGMQVQPMASGGVVVAKIIPGKSAHRDGRLRTGDVLLQINDTDMTTVNNNEMTAVFKEAMALPEISLVVARPEKRTAAIHQRDSLVSTQSLARDTPSQASSYGVAGGRVHHNNSEEQSQRVSQGSGGGSPNPRVIEPHAREIRLPVTQTGLDIAITRGPKDARRNTTICMCISCKLTEKYYTLHVYQLHVH